MAATAASKPAPKPEPKPEPPKPKPEPQPTISEAQATVSPVMKDAEKPDLGAKGLIWWMLAAIAALFVLAYLVRTLQASPKALPAVANTVYATCPAGTIPRNLLDERLLQPGPIINDTEDETD